MIAAPPRKNASGEAGHPAVADRHELGRARLRLALQGRDRVDPVRRGLPTPRARSAARAGVPSARPAPTQGSWGLVSAFSVPASIRRAGLASMI